MTNPRAPIGLFTRLDMGYSRAGDAPVVQMVELAKSANIGAFSVEFEANMADFDLCIRGTNGIITLSETQAKNKTRPG